VVDNRFRNDHTMTLYVPEDERLLRMWEMALRVSGDSHTLEFYWQYVRGDSKNILVVHRTRILLIDSKLVDAVLQNEGFKWESADELNVWYCNELLVPHVGPHHELERLGLMAISHEENTTDE
jgi:hypothetical protein